jgi:hypothetical protein
VEVVVLGIDGGGGGDGERARYGLGFLLDGSQARVTTGHMGLIGLGPVRGSGRRNKDVSGAEQTIHEANDVPVIARF